MRRTEQVHDRGAQHGQPWLDGELSEAHDRLPLTLHGLLRRLQFVRGTTAQLLRRLQFVRGTTAQLKARQRDGHEAQRAVARHLGIPQVNLEVLVADLGLSDIGDRPLKAPIGHERPRDSVGHLV